jgi:hypothetical protein
MGRKFGFSFSLNRALGISAAKQRFARLTGIPTTRGGLDRKIGRMVLGGGSRRRSGASDVAGGLAILAVVGLFFAALVALASFLVTALTYLAKAAFLRAPTRPSEEPVRQMPDAEAAGVPVDSSQRLSNGNGAMILAVCAAPIAVCAILYAILEPIVYRPPQPADESSIASTPEPSTSTQSGATKPPDISGPVVAALLTQPDQDAAAPSDGEGAAATSHESPSPQDDGNSIVGHTATGLPIHEGPRGGQYHYSKSGKKVYERKRK